MTKKEVILTSKINQLISVIGINKIKGLMLRNEHYYLLLADFKFRGASSNKE